MTWSPLPGAAWTRLIPCPDCLAGDIFGNSAEKNVKTNLKQVVTGMEQSWRCGNGQPFGGLQSDAVGWRFLESSREPWIRTQGVRSGSWAQGGDTGQEEKDPRLPLEPSQSPFSALDWHVVQRSGSKFRGW